MGANWNQEDGVKEALVQGIFSSAPMYLLVKDHMVIKEGHHPPSSPVVSSRDEMSHPFYNLLSDFIEPLGRHSAEVISTEDLLSKMDSLNKLLMEEAQSQPQSKLDHNDPINYPLGARVDGDDGLTQKLTEERKNLVLVGADLKNCTRP